MTIQAVNHTLLTESKTVPVDTSASLSFHKKVVGLVSHFFNVDKESIIAHPWVKLTAIAGIGIGAGGIGYYFLVHSRQVPTPSIQQLVDRTQDLLSTHSVLEPRLTVKTFVNKFFQSTTFKQQVGLEGSNEYVKMFLESKLLNIVYSEISPESKVEIITNVIKNYSFLISTGLSRAHADMRKGLLEYLDIDRKDQIAEIHPLGDETHNGGKIPFKIIFKSGKAIVYKPRSMEPERIICDQNVGLLRYEGFGTYRVLSLTDDQNEAYGYSDFIQNIEQENTVSTVEELEKYVRKIYLLEEIARELRISDLHYLNIITARLNPCIIDAEVFLNPPSTPSGIFDRAKGAFHVFDVMQGKDSKWIGKNKIWISSSLTEGKNCNFNFRMSKEDLEEIGVDVDGVQASSRLSEETQDHILSAREALALNSGRYVIKETNYFTSMQPSLDYRRPESIEVFVNSLKEWVAESGFEFEDDATQKVYNGIIEDIRNHDIPVFYYNSKNQKLIYHNTIIGTLSN